jgi:hypothetical protein
MKPFAAIGAFVLAAGGLGADAPAPASTDRGTVLVTLADGTTVPLRNWTFSYEYAVYGKGVSPLAAPTARKETADFYLGKRALAPGSLSTVEVQYQQMGALSVARTMTLGLAGGKSEKQKVAPPHEDLVAPDAEKGKDVLVRTLDLRGETVTGTRRDLCVLSYTSFVQCGTTVEDRVVKLQFQR